MNHKKQHCHVNYASVDELLDGNIAQVDTQHACVTRRKPYERVERKLAMGRAMLIAAGPGRAMLIGVGPGNIHLMLGRAIFI